MTFNNLVKRLTIDIFMFLALLLSLVFFWYQMIPFIKAAILLDAVNMQTVSYLAYSILLICMPLFFLLVQRTIEKGLLLRYMFYGFSAVILLGTISDIIKYHGFINYNFMEGDAVFINMIFNMPNLFGVLASILLAILYFQLGKSIRRNRKKSLMLFMAIFSVSFILPFLVSFILTGLMPRATWLEKAAYIISEHILLLVSLCICATSRTLWKKHIWTK